jgi:hypothetical protein
MDTCTKLDKRGEPCRGPASYTFPAMADPAHRLFRCEACLAWELLTSPTGYVCMNVVALPADRKG